MAEATVCPLLLVCEEDLQPIDFETTRVAAARKHLEELRRLRITPLASRVLVDQIRYLLPWQKIDDPIWKGWLLDWSSSVLEPMLKVTRIVDVDMPEVSDDKASCEAHKDEQLDRLWKSWLQYWLQGRRVDLLEKGIAGWEWCEAVSEAALDEGCGAVVVAAKPADWRLVVFPWLRLYDERLPTGGAFPFLPPQNWKQFAAPPRGNQYGFLDAKGNEWCWDRLHRDHWDVQLTAGGYHSVNIEGEIL